MNEHVGTIWANYWVEREWGRIDWIDCDPLYCDSSDLCFDSSTIFFVLCLFCDSENIFANFPSIFEFNNCKLVFFVFIRNHHFVFICFVAYLPSSHPYSTHFEFNNFRLLQILRMPVHWVHGELLGGWPSEIFIFHMNIELELGPLCPRS